MKCRDFANRFIGGLAVSARADRPSFLSQSAFSAGYGGSMARIFITGSTDGLGRAAARSLLDDGHEVVLHARSTERASTLADLASRSAGVVIGDLRSAAETRRIAEQVNAIGRMGGVIH